MKKPKLRELGEAVKALVRGPATIGFPAEPYEPPEGFRGKPQYDADRTGNLSYLLLSIRLKHACSLLFRHGIVDIQAGEAYFLDFIGGNTHPGFSHAFLGQFLSFISYGLCYIFQ